MNKRLHWSGIFFNQPVRAITVLKGGLQHQTDLIELGDHSKWVCKKLSKQIWLGTMSRQRLELTNDIAGRAAESVMAVTAKYQGNLSGFGEACFQIFPYCEGKIIGAVKESQAFSLGKMLARLHLLSLPGDEAEGFPPVCLPQTQSHPPWLSSLVDQCNHYRFYRANQRVVSHRDLHLGNIVWRDEQTPCLIDWESAGLIHPFVELIGLATNCSGLAATGFNKALFQAVVSGYGQQAGKIPTPDPILWEMALHSWLLWYAYNLNRAWNEEAKNTLLALEFMLAHMEEVKQLYQCCNESQF
ncbi:MULTISPECIES: phosphotransferase enzyme family protein [unclassified Legionella]|uniref:phosphotransferase enzyme family protein n=1 Tax=unclassified Legionella TaxID=2622702 RepID=UPI0010560C27|nr:MULTISPECIES: phosphotransferase [unclassified Legionella]MDI9819224.1 phosphotransferase [Legionella sp. PL877]